MKEENRKGIIALVWLALIFATMGIFVRYLDTSFALFEQTYLRIAVAFVIGSIIFYRDITFKKFISLSRRDVLVLIARSILLYIAVVLFTQAILITKYSNAALAAAIPLLPLFGYVFLKEKLSRQIIFYILMGCVGAVLVALGQGASLEFSCGELLALLSTIFFDMSYIARKWHSDYLNDKESAVFMFFSGSIFLFICSMLVGESLPILDQFNSLIILALVGSAIFNVANLYLTNYGFRRVKAGIAGNILSLEIVFAMLYSIFLFKETPTIVEAVGGVIIFASILLVNRESSKEL